jgi:hypothetical protein
MAATLLLVSAPVPPMVPPATVMVPLLVRAPVPARFPLLR